MPAIEVEDLYKSYGPVQAVKGVSLHVGEGEVFSLLGPNGAGKTTTVEILEGYRTRNSGRVSVLGHDPAEAGPELKQRIGIVLQQTGVEDFLTTHYMDEAQYLADRVAVIAGGVIVAEGPPSTLAGRETAATRIRFRAPADLPSLPAIQSTSITDGVAELRTQDPTRALHELTAWAIGRGASLEGLE